MDGFGPELRRLRVAAGMRQLDLVEALDRVIARSTLANVEVGRENPSARLWEAIGRARPDWAEELQPWYPGAQAGRRRTPLQPTGPCELVSTRHIYTFRDHRAPEEIMLLRRVRAMADGVDGYQLSLTSTGGHFDLDTESLFGGWIEEHERHGAGGGRLLTRFHFDRTLALGEEHEFGTRSWVSHDEPESAVAVRFTRPTRNCLLVTNFLGPRPRLVWRFESEGRIDDAPAPRSSRDLLTLGPDGSCSLQLPRVAADRTHGIAWAW